MLDALRFVKGAVAKATYAPELKHFYISNGRVVGYNGRVMLSCPIDLDIEAAPKAAAFVRAIEACTDEVSMHLTKSGRLAIKSGRFRSYVDCEDVGRIDVPAMDGWKSLVVDESFREALKILEPFISEDASRPWSRGILFRGQSLYATNNIVLIEHWVPKPFPVELNLQRGAVKELLRLRHSITELKQSEQHIAFYFDNGGWMQTNTLVGKWPDVSPILDAPNDQIPFTAEIKELIEKLAPFTDEKTRSIRFQSSQFATSEHEDEGTIIELDAEIPPGRYNVDQLLGVAEIADTIDFSSYPKPCLFYGKNLRGALIGMRDE